MSSGPREVICSTVFQGFGQGFFGFYARNCQSSVGDNPQRIGIGHYQTFTPDFIEQTKCSVTSRAYEINGFNRIVTVVMAILSFGTQIDIFIRTDVAGALTDDFLVCEVTVARLPL